MAQRPSLLVLFAFLALFLATAACGERRPWGGTGRGGGGRRPDLAEIEMLRVRDEDGRVWTFVTDGALEKNGAHLRLHQVLGETIEVSYEEHEGRLVATALRD